MEHKVKELIETTNLTLQQIADNLGTTYKIVWAISKRCYTREQRLNRKVLNYRRSKLGDLNPMTGRVGEAHPNFKGEIANATGYIMVLKPDWYTGRARNKYVFKHTVVICSAMGLTEIPPGFEAHHIDGDKQNNDLTNLALLSMAAHIRIHQLERATTSRKT